MSMRIAIVVLAACAFVSYAHAWTDPGAAPEARAPVPPLEEPSSIHTLGDIKRITVLIRGTNSREWGRFGFTDAEVREAITRKLVASGFEVAGPSGAVSDPDTVILEVAVHVNDQALNNSFLVFLRLKEKLPLPQNPEGFITKTIWSDWKLGGFEPYNYKKLRGIILTMVDEFLRTYTLQP